MEVEVNASELLVPVLFLDYLTRVACASKDQTLYEKGCYCNKICIGSLP